MSEGERAAAVKRAAILEAATGVFLRYGFKKTSMDDLARAAGLSRQGLYLHFPTKEALFKEAVLRLIATIAAETRAALGDEGRELETRLLDAFVAGHGSTLDKAHGAHMSELLAASRELVGPALGELEQGFEAEIARLLRSSGVAARWKELGISAKELAEQLHALSYGLKHRGATSAEYREKMRVAVKMVCRGGK
jgi:AcrR family transcriptional regulator